MALPKSGGCSPQPPGSYAYVGPTIFVLALPRVLPLGPMKPKK